MPDAVGFGARRAGRRSAGVRVISRFAPGTPCWVDLGSPDIAASAAFYGGLFGWTAFTAAEPEAGGYTTFLKDGQAVAAVGPLAGPEQPPAWTVYFATPDADALSDRVRGAGGGVLMAPFDVFDYGRMAVCADPEGAVFGVWQAGTMEGADLLAAQGALGWVELASRDPEGARGFYRLALQVGDRVVPYESFEYTLWLAGDAAVAGMVPMEGDLWPVGVPPHWMVYFVVADCDYTAARVSELRGSVSVPPTDTPAGRFAVLGDPHGALFSIITPDADFQP
jgi:predicted enzyme related to lactoylglutathione lyase